MNSVARLLIVDDEPEIRNLIERYFSRLKFEVLCAGSGSEMKNILDQQAVDIVLLDVCLPDTSGITLLAQLKRHFPLISVIMLTAQAETEQRIAGLNQGADDYLPKPFDTAELHARVNAVLRRNNTAVQSNVGASLFHFENFTLDTRTRSLHDEKRNSIELSPAEYDLLLVMLKNPGTVLDRDFLMRSTRGRASSAFDRTIDVRMGQLRKKLCQNGQANQLFSTVRGAGYMINCNVEVVEQ